MATMQRTVMDNDLLGPSPFSAVAWSAVFAGAVTAMIVSLALLMLGSGLGLATISLWPQQGSGAESGMQNAATYTIAAMIWVAVTQWVSAACGGYLAGRMRTQATGLHSSEVLFRDRAHGFLCWVAATLLTVAFLTSAMTSMVKGGANVATTLAAAQMQDQPAGGGDVSTDPMAYYMDNLFRTTTGPAATEGRDEAVRIVLRGIQSGSIPDADRQYLAQMTASRTGISTAEASQRVDSMIAAIDTARQQADDARKAAATFSVLSFVALLIGAIIAAMAAGVGGRRRDRRRA